MLPALLAIGLGALLSAALAAYTGGLADALGAGALSLVIGLGGLDDLRGRVVVGRACGRHHEPESDQDISERFKAAR